MPGITPTGPATLINGLPGNEQYENATAALVGGGRAVAWIDFTTGQVRFIVYDGLDRVVWEESRADSLPGEKRAPVIIPDADGGFFLSWTYTDAGGKTSIASREVNGLDLAEKFFIGTEVLIDLGGFAPLATAAGAPLAGGGNALVWENGRGTFDIFGLIRNGQGAAGAQFPVNTTTSGTQAAPAVIANDQGFWTLWNSNASGTPQIILQQLDIQGTKVGPEIMIGAATSNAELGPDAAFLDDGTFVVTFVRPASGGGEELIARIYAPLAGGLQPEILVAALPNGIVGVPAVSAVAGNGFIVSWINNNPVGADPLLGRAYDASGASPVPFGDPFTIADSARFQISSGSSRLEDGRIAFSWDGSRPGDSQGVFLRIFQVGDFGNVPTAGNDELWDGTPASLNSSTIDGLGGNDVIRGYGGDDSLNGGDGNDRLFGGPGDDAMNGGSGDDFGLIGTPFDSFIGGPGNDTAGVQGNFIGTLGISADTETLLVASGKDNRFGDYSGNLYDYSLTMAAIDRPLLNVIASDLSSGEDLLFDGGALSGGGIRVFGGGGLTRVTGGSGSDGSLFGTPAAYNPLNVFDGGPGTDTIAFRGSFILGSALMFNDASFPKVEVVALLSGHTNEFGGFIDLNGFDYSLTVAQGNVAPGQTAVLSGTGLRANETVNFDAAAETDGAWRIFLGAGNDMVVGSSGADLIFGSLGADQLDGGPGSDSYVYLSVLDSTPSSQDVVMFGAGDRFDLSRIDADSSSPGINDAFTFIGAAAFGSVAGQLRAADGLIQGDINGDGIADLQIGYSGAPPAPPDFIL